MATVESSLERATEQYNAGDLSLNELEAIAKENNMPVKKWYRDKQRHPDSVGNNRSRCGFVFDCLLHPHGVFFQNVTKKLTLVAIDIGYAAFFSKNRVVKWAAQHALTRLISTIHSALTHAYDPEIFVYDDDRINMINDFWGAYIKENFQHAFPYKNDFMMQVKDIICGMLAKEDVYYRARMFDAVNKFRTFYPREIPLSGSEKENIKEWH